MLFGEVKLLKNRSHVLSKLEKMKFSYQKDQVCDL